MRNDFVKQTMIEMEKNKNIFFLTGDLGFNALEPIRDAFPDRFINVGIAEANMIGVASGLALSGKTVIAYSIASFLTMRAYEQIRTDVCYHNLNVKLFGPGGGYNYAAHGITHHTVEDIAIMRVLPHMKVLNPAYSWEASGATKVALNCDGPTYTRLAKNPAMKFDSPKSSFELGRGYEIKNGKDIVILSTGNILDVAFDTARLIESSTKKSVSVISMPSIKPLASKLILNKAKNAEAMFTMEEHSEVGGFGGAVAELLVQNNVKLKVFKIFGLPADRFIKDVGSRDYLLSKAGLSSMLLSDSIKKLL
jgi:transketolase